MKNHSTAKRLRRSAANETRAQPRCGWESTKICYPRVAEAATLSWRAQPLCGSPLNERPTRLKP